MRKLIAAATAAALFSIPSVASAVTAVAGGTLGDGTDFSYSEDPFLEQPDGSTEITFTIDTDERLLVRVGGSVDSILDGQIESFKVSWSLGGTTGELGPIGTGGFSLISLERSFEGLSGTDVVLTIEWTGAVPGPDGKANDNDFAIEVEASVVPLPATALLFGTALAGLGLARRRK
jgi:hypothetical protein